MRFCVVTAYSPFSKITDQNPNSLSSCFFFSSRRRHTRLPGDWSSDVCSSDLGVPDPQTGEKPEWVARKNAYLAHLASATPSELLVSSADKLHNARSILADYRELGDELWARFRGGREGTLWYYRALSDRFRAVSDSAIVHELGQIVTELEELARGNASVGEAV